MGCEEGLLPTCSLWGFCLHPNGLQPGANAAGRALGYFGTTRQEAELTGRTERFPPCPPAPLLTSLTEPVGKGGEKFAESQRVGLEPDNDLKLTVTSRRKHLRGSLRFLSSPALETMEASALTEMPYDPRGPWSATVSHQMEVTALSHPQT